MRILFSLLLGSFGLLIGLQFFASQHNSTEQKRTMASVKSQFDLSCLKSDELNEAVKKRILNGLKTLRKSGNLGFEIGHYIYSPEGSQPLTDCHLRHSREVSSWNNESEKKRLACKEYPQIKLTFTADDSSASGEKKKFEVEAECRVSQDIAKTEVIWIPWEKLAKESPFEGEAQFAEPTKVSIRTHHVMSEWPKKWILESIELKGTSGVVSVNQQDIGRIAGRPIAFDFP